MPIQPINNTPPTKTNPKTNYYDKHRRPTSSLKYLSKEEREMFETYGTTRKISAFESIATGVLLIVMPLLGLAALLSPKTKTNAKPIIENTENVIQNTKNVLNDTIKTYKMQIK